MAKICDKIISRILSQDDVRVLPEDIACHIENCAECAAEYKKILEMQALLQEAVPETPDIKGTVMSRLDGETIAPAPRRRSSFRMATLAAAAAALAVYVSVYGTGLMDSFVGKDAANEGIFVEDAEIGFADTPQSASILADRAEPESAESENVNVAQSVSFKKSPAGASGAANSALADGAAVVTEKCKSLELYNDCVDDLARTEIVVPEEFAARITDEQIDAVGREIYDLFVESIADFESEYTYENLLNFAEEHK